MPIAATSDAVFAGLPRHLLDSSGNVIYLVGSDLRVAYCNPAWDAFARANNGEGALAAEVMGMSALEVVAEPLREFYRRVFEDARSTLLPISFDFECSSADVRRLMRMEVRWVPTSDAYALTSAVRQEQEHSDEAHPANRSVYLARTGLIAMCCHCRKTRRGNEPGVWDWVPQYVRHMPGNVTHSICPPCMAYFYPDVFSRVCPSA